MSEGFIRTARGALNLRHVRRIYEEKLQNGLTGHTAVMDDGGEYYVELGNEALDQLCQRVVPATAGDAACFLSIDGDKEDPTVEDVSEQHMKIVAWGVSTNYGGGCYGVEPIYLENPASNQTPILACPDGAWLLQEDMSFATLVEAKEEILRRHRERGGRGDG